MNKDELRAIVARMLREEGVSAPGEAPAREPEAPPVQEAAEAEVIGDITREDLRRVYRTAAPAAGEAFLALKARTPARLGQGRAGTRYRTESYLRFRADHAAARDSVLSELPEDLAQARGWLPLRTCCRDKGEYLTRPDLGRLLQEESAARLRAAWKGEEVLLAVGDGLSASAVCANAPDCAAAIVQGLQARKLSLGPVPLIRFCRVGVSEHMGRLTDCSLVCLLVGERPGLVTNQSMSAYLTYRPRPGTPESCRTVVSNIHAQGIPAVEAGAHIAGLIEEILRRKVSGVALTEEAE